MVTSKESWRSSCTLHNNYLLTFDSYGPVRKRGECIIWASGGEGALDTPGHLNGRPDVGGQNFAPIDLHKTDAASDWLLIKRQCIGTKGLPGVQLQN